MAAGPRTLLSFRLPTNRLISWAEYGSPKGRPLLFLHGTPSSRLECAEFHNELKTRNIRLIAPDRPGFGRSEFLPGRTIGGYATDVLALAKHLDLTKYYVMGGSGGGPYALACARYLQPQDGLQGVCVFAGMAPYDCGLKGVNWRLSLSFGMANWTPRLLRFIMRSALPTPTGNFTGPIDQWTVDPSAQEDSKKNIEAFVKTLKGREKEVMSKPGVVDYMAAATLESLIQGFDPYMHEAKLFAQPWDFKIEDITFASEGKGPIYLVYGTDDVNTTIHMGRWIAERVGGSSLEEVEGETHFTIGEKFVDYCDEFLQMT
ncbi:Alpha/Beta hydrolase protein [Fusarium tricinctum]|uniref:Alpha/Beta hydrolase protein n=1 Tax=Fusarium tricinctum TaxID=61284 RepID=A0A8K0S6P2_9HYPO|nr:Alpha/Beta hydrolase protein [Fusarium tricinctum]